jgi:phospholipid transport system substrate-binding protein
MRKVLWLAFPALVFAITGAFAPQVYAVAEDAVASAADAPAAPDAPAGKFIQGLGDRVISMMADQSMTPDQRLAHYHDMLKTAFDLKTIGHFVIGRAWNTATPAQRDEYMQLFEKLVLKTYGDRLNFYSGETFHVRGTRPESDEDFIVNSEITHADGSAPTKIDWRVREKGGKDAIIDVVVEGVSQSITQRQEYASIIEGDGGKLDNLLDLMRQRVASAQ